jgi:hypothetical protein
VTTTPTESASSLEQRIRRLEDHDAILGLKAFYARCADEKYTDDHRRKPQPEIDAITRRQVDAVFTEDAVWDGGPQFGTIRGREAIYDHLRLGGWSFSMHFYVNPVIALDGDRAEADWMLWQTCTFEKSELAVWMAATTHDHYVRTADGWRMARMTFCLKFITRFDQPWSVDRNAPIRT